MGPINFDVKRYQVNFASPGRSARSFSQARRSFGAPDGDAIHGDEKSAIKFTAAVIHLTAMKGSTNRKQPPNQKNQ